MEALTRMIISGIIFMCLANVSKGSCRLKPQLATYNLTDLVPISPFGLQQCERECFSDTNCLVMVYYTKNLECYKGLNGNGATATENLNFVVKLRSELASDLDTSYLCGDHPCENGFSCVSLSSGISVCIAGVCRQPLSISNAAVAADSYAISSTATYSCNAGYYPIGTAQIMCGSSLEWTVPALVCCKDTFTYHQGTQMMYKVFTINKIYSDALDHCAGLGAGLVKVNSTERMNALSGYLASGQFYTDASDQATEGTWIFSDGSSVDMSLFFSSEPDGGTNENCAIFGSGSNLYDVRCSTDRYFICEIR